MGYLRSVLLVGRNLLTVGTVRSFVASKLANVADVKSSTRARVGGAMPAVPVIARLRLGPANDTGGRVALCIEHPNTNGVDDSCLDVGELREIGELNVVALRDALTNGLIKGDDAAVENWVCRCKQPDDVLPIASELLRSVRENENCGGAHAVKRNVPHACVADDFGRCDSAETKFHTFADGFGALVADSGGEQATKNCVEVNGAAVDKIRPLGIGKLGAVRGGEKGPLRPLWVNKEKFEKTECFGESWLKRVEGGLNDFGNRPRILRLEVAGAPTRSFKNWRGKAPVRV
jgi:hypothetical protein